MLHESAEPRLTVLRAGNAHQTHGKPLGETQFASATAAYNALPPATRQKIAGLKAVQSYKKRYYRDRNSGRHKPLTLEQEVKTRDIEHPIVRTHPVTSKKCLFVNED